MAKRGPADPGATRSPGGASPPRGASLPSAPAPAVRPGPAGAAQTGQTAQTGRPGGVGRARLTSRAAVLAVVLCAVALSLAYPIREYIAQRRQIDQLQAQRQLLVGQLVHFQREQHRLSDPAYVRRLAMDELHLCLPGATCYVVVKPGPGSGSDQAAATLSTPWYERLWRSVKVADQGRSR